MVHPLTIKGRPYLALALTQIQSHADVKALRDALLDVIGTCIADEDAKDATESRSLRILLNMVVELNKDLED